MMRFRSGRRCLTERKREGSMNIECKRDSQVTQKKRKEIEKAAACLNKQVIRKSRAKIAAWYAPGLLCVVLFSGVCSRITFYTRPKLMLPAPRLFHLRWASCLGKKTKKASKSLYIRDARARHTAHAPRARALSGL